MIERSALIVGDAAQPADTVAKVLTRFGFGAPETVPSLAAAVTRLRAAHFDLVILPLEGLGPVESALIEHDIRRAAPLLIGVAHAASPELLLTAMRAGIPEFVTAPINAKELDAAIDRLVRRTTRTPSATGITFAVYSAKGGLGTTTVAVNLAAALAHASPDTRIALVDFVVVGGDIRVMLDAKVAYDVGDLVSKVDRIDAELLNALLTPGPDGVWLLPSSEKTEVLDLIDANAATSILAHLRSHFGYVVVDTEHYLGERTLAALDAAEHILLVTQLSVPALRSAQRTLQLFDRLGYDGGKVHVVVNRANAESPLSASDAESVLGRPIEWKLPNDFGACTAATTKGVPVIDIATNAPLARSYRDLVARLLAGRATPATDGTLVPPTPKPGRLFRLAGR